jgi:hypothetical protein
MIEARALRELLEGATDGPWWVESERSWPSAEVVANVPQADGGDESWWITAEHADGPNDADADLIVALRNNASDLLEALEENERLRDESEMWRPYIDHKRDCPQAGSYDRDCPCGYVQTLRSAVLAALNPTEESR